MSDERMILSKEEKEKRNIANALAAFTEGFYYSVAIWLILKGLVFGIPSLDVVLNNYVIGGICMIFFLVYANNSFRKNYIPED